LNALGDELVARGQGFAVTRESTSGKISSLIYHYPEGATLTVPASFDTRDVADATLALGEGVQLDVEFTWLPPGTPWPLATIHADPASAGTRGESQGRSNNLSRPDVESLKAAARVGMVEEHKVGSDGVLRISRR